ncbi:MAG TPA: alpha/beta hydrolase [Roseiflexaceae bacterium]|nr:alpha/beta hydrolase [Roseiflexaceae bacterium]
MVRTSLRFLGSVILLIAAVPLGALAGVGGFFGAALLSSAIPALVVSGGVALLLSTLWLARIAGRGLFPQRSGLRRALADLAVGTTLLLTGLVAAEFVFQPMSVRYVAKEPTAQTRYWELMTGSRLAYVHTPAQGAPRSTPIIHLHGGPGAPANFTSQALDAELAVAGFDVYRYDQVGAGASARLADVTAYSVERHVADLEAIRRKLGAERVILIGGSWGGTLAAHYLAAHPGRVERVVFSSPGPIWAPAFAGNNTGSSGNVSAIVSELATLRFVVVYALQQVNPQAAANLASDTEMSAFFQQILVRVIAADVAGCSPAAEPPLSPPTFPRGFGYYANMLTAASLARTPDPRTALTGQETPALVLRGACDRMLPEVHQEYVTLLPNATLVTLDGVGHAVDRAPQYGAAVRSFVLGERLPDV